MNAGPLDWLIIFITWVILVSSVPIAKKYMRSVADYLSAGRSAGRYILSVAQGIAALGAISVVAMMEQNYVAGFSMSWWGLTMNLVVLAVTASGWVIYRFRETRCLTLAEFFERRYSKKFRIFSGLIAFISGIVNFGIFPAVGARFFLNYLGLPESLSLLGFDIPTFAILMLFLLGTSLYFVFSGGHVAVTIADFIQGVFSNVVFIWMILFFLFNVSWDQIFYSLNQAPENASLINPFKTSQVEDFNLGFFLIGILIYIYGTMSWQGTQAYNASAKNAHEAKMGSLLGNWRNIPQNLFMLFIPIIAYTVLHHPDFSLQADFVNATLSNEENNAVVNQLRVPAVLISMLPPGLMGAFAAVMLAAFISTHDTYLHSWGSIFVQDVYMPFQKKPLTQEKHLKILKWSTIGVAIFIFIFSLIFQQSEYILLFFAITGAIFFGGSGAVLIGGLYWNKGTTKGAWWAMSLGASLSVFGIFGERYIEAWPGWLNGQVMTGIVILCCIVTYVLVSLNSKQAGVDLNKLLYRGKHETEKEKKLIQSQVPRGLKAIGITEEFTKSDRRLYYITYTWVIGWFLTFLIGTIYNLNKTVVDDSWIAFWKAYMWINVVVAILVTIWFTYNGFNDLKGMLKELKRKKIDIKDNGFISDDNI